MKKNAQFLLILAGTLIVSGVHADVFGTGPNQFTMDFQNINYAGNSADNTGYGAVAYNYRVGKFEVTIDQFAKAYASDSSISNGDEGSWLGGVGVNAPASKVTFYEAAKFANWLTSGSANSGAYMINGSGQVTGVDRAGAVSTYGMVYVVPTEDEWYKAAHFKPDATYGDYRTYSWPAPNSLGAPGVRAMYDSNTVWAVGSGVVEQNGTYDMLGNIREWTESSFAGSTNFADDRVARGGYYTYGEYDLRADNSRESLAPGVNHTFATTGFRVVAIPEPGTMSLMGISTCGLFITRRVRRRKLAGSSLMPIRRRPNACDVFEHEDKAHEYVLVDEIAENNYLSIMMDQVIEWSSAAWSWTYRHYKSVDVLFWNKMVVSHEKRVIRSKARRANFKKKVLAGFDAFLALIMK